jgi:UDP-N-acetylglucosamine--N-acetylmuramyl-(pentapeptide) pyrophosphoryl-undecaprenol N-acetylglucosamine transferase
MNALGLVEANTEFLWLGNPSGFEAGLVPASGIPFKAIAAAPLRGKNPAGFLKGIMRLAQGYVQSRRIVAEFKPDALFITGGYVSAPVAMAARSKKVPLVIYLPDIRPGLAIKFLARLAAKVAITTPETSRYFQPGKTVISGYPVRPELLQRSKSAARLTFALSESLPVLLVFGGSQGARSINQALRRCLEGVLPIAQVIHISGSADYPAMQAMRNSLTDKEKANYHLYEYLHQEMVDALLAADLIVSRAGASVLGEYPAIGVASILAPYPFAGRHQQLNAEYLQSHGAAVIIDNNDLPDRLLPTINRLLSDPGERQKIAAAAQALARPEAAMSIARTLVEMS